MVPTGDIFGLLQPRGGLFGAVLRFQGQCDEPRLITQVAQSGDVGQVWPHVRRKHGLENSRPAVTGAGTGLEDDEPRLLALAEGLERYCACVYRKEQFTWATADELGSEALDLDTLPKCSEKELSHPRCPLMAPDRKARIRWVRGISLLDGRLVHIPAVMVYLYTGVANPGERFWLPITTGCAAHTTYERALLSAILEVIERDAISIIWLQKLSLPRLELDRMPPTLAHYWDRYQRSSRDLEYVFFDATTDVGVPIVYGLQIARENERLTTLVSCSTSLNPAEALVKVMRDMASGRIAFRNSRPTPENWDDFRDVSQGAAYMARAERSDAFSFLLESGRTRSLSDMAALDFPDSKQALQVVLELLRRKGMEAFAVDLSTDEALRSGMRVVRVVVPGLHPLSFHYRARYLGHRRLYEAPLEMGYPVSPEEQVNHWPQPFD